MKWEYIQVAVHPGAKEIEVFNEFGEEGWEMTGAPDFTGRCTIAYFKRAKAVEITPKVAPAVRATRVSPPFDPSLHPGHPLYRRPIPRA